MYTLAGCSMMIEQLTCHFMFRKKHERFKMMRMKKELVHRTSRTSFANVEHKLKIASKDPNKVTRTDVWLYGYTSKKKKDNGVVEDPEVVKKVREKASHETNLSQRSIDDDPVLKNEVEVKNALSVLEPPTGNEDASSCGCDGNEEVDVVV